MPSPFPGMNPYLEQRDVWRDFHGTFLGRLREGKDFAGIGLDDFAYRFAAGQGQQRAMFEDMFGEAQNVCERVRGPSAHLPAFRQWRP